MCYRGLLGLLSRTLNEVWDFFKKLAWDTYEFEQARGTLGYPIHSEYVNPANLHHQKNIIDSYDHQYYSCVPPILCDYCESSDHYLMIVLIVIMWMLRVQFKER